MHRLYLLVLVALLSAMPPVTWVEADTPQPVLAKKKTTSAVMAAKRSKATPPKTVSSHARSSAHTTATAHSNTVTHAATTRKVVVSRKKVNGRWVRTTQIVRVPAAPSYQLRPDTERYQQIQQALATKGFFKGEPNGEWNDDSVDALKRYQTSANLPNDGKINSLALIGLGLGPKHDGSITPPAAVSPSSSQP